MSKATTLQTSEESSDFQTTNLDVKICFVITPMSSIESGVRRKADGLVRSVIKPMLESPHLNFKVVAPQEMHGPGSISNQVISHLLTADLVIANLTGLNPNVMYELAVRHAIRKTVISIAEEDTVLPFDLNQERTIRYRDDMMGVEKLKEDLQEAIFETMQVSDKKHDNPIYRVATELLVRNEGKAPEFGDLVLDRLNELSNKIDNILNRNPSNLSVTQPSSQILFKKLEYELSDIQQREIFISALEEAMRRRYIVDYKIDSFDELKTSVTIRATTTELLNELRVFLRKKGF